MKRLTTKARMKMNRREFNELINYISNRPDEALRLEAVINKAKMGKTPGQVTDVERDTGRWLTASEVGREMGRSHQWVKDKDKILFQMNCNWNVTRPIMATDILIPMEEWHGINQVRQLQRDLILFLVVGLAIRYWIVL